jgi:hypothetical protein
MARTKQAQWQPADHDAPAPPQCRVEITRSAATPARVRAWRQLWARLFTEMEVSAYPMVGKESGTDPDQTQHRP